MDWQFVLVSTILKVRIDFDTLRERLTKGIQMNTRQQIWCEKCKRWEAEYVLPRHAAFLDENERSCGYNYTDDERMPVMVRRV